MAEGLILSEGKLYDEAGNAVPNLSLDGLVVDGISLAPVALGDLPAASTPLTGFEEVALDLGGVAVRATIADLAGGPTDTRNGVTRDRQREFEDFDGFATAVTANATIIVGTLCRTQLTGTGAQVAQGQGIGEKGIADLHTGTTATGRAAVEPHQGILFLFNGAARYQVGARVKLPTVSDGTETWRAVIGMGDMTSATPAQGIFFRSPTAAGNWRAVVRDASADIADIDTGVATETSAFHNFMVEFVPGVGARWYIDGILRASLANVDIENLDNMGSWGVGIHKSAGLTNRILEVDCLSWDLPSGRNLQNLP